MPPVESTMMSLGTPAPAFSLHDVVSGKDVSLDDFAGKPLLVMFLCNHCPFVKHVADELASLGRDFGDRLGVVAIMPNDVANYPDDAPDKMKQEASTRGYTFPYLYDETQAVAKAYTAACTPDFFLFDSSHSLQYRGQLDDSRPKTDTPVTGKDLRSAIESVLAGNAPSSTQKPSIGCGIKWKAGNAPSYAGG